MIAFLKKHSNIIFLAVVLIFLSVIVGYKSFLTLTYKFVQPISSPDKIYIYASGKQSELNRESPIFRKIVKATNSRLSSNISTATDIVDDKLVKEFKEDTLGIEFIYNHEQNLSIKGDGFRPFTYYKLYFPLKSKQFGTQQGSIVYTMQYGNKEHYIDCSRGPLTEPNKIINLVLESLTASKNHPNAS